MLRTLRYTLADSAKTTALYAGTPKIPGNPLAQFREENAKPVLLSDVQFADPSENPFIFGHETAQVCAMNESGGPSSAHDKMKFPDSLGLDRWCTVEYEKGKTERGDDVLVRMPAAPSAWPMPRWANESLHLFVWFDQICAKSILMLAEAHAKGNYRELMNLPVTDPKHPFYYEHPHTLYFKQQRYLAKQRSRFNTMMPRMTTDWWFWCKNHQTNDNDMFGQLTDDFTPWNHHYVQEGLRRISSYEYECRTRRILRQMTYAENFEVLPEEEWVHPMEDVSYLTPHCIQALYEGRESGFQHLNFD